MPGTARCARCGTSMALQTQVIDVHPPRARRWGRSRQGVVRGSNTLRNGVEGLLGRLESRRPGHDTSTFTMPVLLRCLLPGWPQFYMRRPRRGMFFMIGGAFLAVVALVLVGSFPGTAALALLFSLHAASVCDAATPPGRHLRESIAIGLAVYICLGLFLYLPVIRLFTSFITPYVLQQAIVPFQVGDVLLVRPTQSPPRGSVVVFERAEPLRLQLQGNLVLYVGGMGIDRVLAVAGDTIASEKGVVTINGEVTRMRPLNRQILPDFQIAVPNGYVFIWPSAAPRLAESEHWQQAVLLRQADVRGPVLWRTYPWSRAGSVQ